MKLNKLVSGSILEIPLPLGLGYGYGVYILVNDFLPLTGTVDRIIIPLNYYSQNRIAKIEFPIVENEITAPILTFLPTIRGEKKWKIVGYEDPLKFNFKKITYRRCTQYKPLYYGKETELVWFQINDYALKYDKLLDISKNLHLEHYTVYGPYNIECRILFELNEYYNIDINYEELLKEIPAKVNHAEFMIRPRYKDIPKEFWGKVIE